MVIYKHLSGTLLWFSLGIFLLLSSTKAEKYEMAVPPFMEWRRAYGCILQETNSTCQYKLNMSGILIVPKNEVAGYCSAGGCADQMRTVLNCIHRWKRDFWFANKAPVHFINDAISLGCSNTTKIDTTSYSSASSMRLYKSVSVPILSVLFVIIFNI